MKNVKCVLGSRINFFLLLSYTDCNGASKAEPFFIFWLQTSKKTETHIPPIKQCFYILDKLKTSHFILLSSTVLSVIKTFFIILYIGSLLKITVSYDAFVLL